MKFYKYKKSDVRKRFPNTKKSSVGENFLSQKCCEYKKSVCQKKYSKSEK